MKQQTKSFKNAFSFPLCLFFLFLIEYQHVSKRKNQILTPSKGALISKHLEAPEDHQGSHSPFVTQCFSLPLAPPPPPLALPFLLGVISESSLRQPDNPDTHIQTAVSASFSFHSRQQRLPRRALARRKVMLKYFRRKCTPYCSFSGCRAEFQSQFSFVFENKEGETLMRRLQKLSFFSSFFFGS